MSDLEEPVGAAVARSRRRTILKFSLAGIAVLGIGAAITTAAWTGDVWFHATATAESANLQGSTDGTNFTIAPTQPQGLDFSVPNLTGLLPGANTTVTLYVRNAGTSTVDLTKAAPVTDGTIWDGDDAATLTVSALADTTLAPGATTTFTVTVTTDAGWPDSYEGSSGTIDIQVNGVAQVP